MRNLPKGRTAHFSFLVKKNEIISVGWNNYYKTHPLSKKFGYYNGIHSELSCIVSCQRSMRGTYMINTRIKNGDLAISKPCNICQRMLLWYNIENIVYSNDKGEFECLSLSTMRTKIIITK